MGRGRRPAGAGIVERLDGSTEAKKRLRLILETLAGQRTMALAGRLLGISERRFYVLRKEFLSSALDMLEPRPIGRPGRVPAAGDERLMELETEVQRLQVELRAAQIREEIALVMPHLLRRTRAKKKVRTSRRLPAAHSPIEKSGTSKA
jgi:hypothetical protein